MNESINFASRSKGIIDNNNNNSYNYEDYINSDNNSSSSRFINDFDNVTDLAEGSFGKVMKARRKIDNTYYAVYIYDLLFIILFYFFEYR